MAGEGVRNATLWDSRGIHHVMSLLLDPSRTLRNKWLLSEVISTAQVQRTHLGIIKKTHHLLALAEVGLVLLIFSKDFQCFMFQERTICPLFVQYVSHDRIL